MHVMLLQKSVLGNNGKNIMLQSTSVVYMYYAKVIVSFNLPGQNQTFISRAFCLSTDCQAEHRDTSQWQEHANAHLNNFITMHVNKAKQASHTPWIKKSYPGWNSNPRRSAVWASSPSTELRR